MAGKFKDFSKKLGDAAKNTARKSEELIETGKIKGKIKEEEREIEKLKMEIGEKAFQKFMDKEEIFSEAVELCEAIIAAKDRSAEYEMKILELKHIRVCSACNAEVDNTIAFCPNCGNKFEPIVKEEPEQEPEGKVCGSCKAPIEDDTLFCPSCGAKVE